MGKYRLEQARWSFLISFPSTFLRPPFTSSVLPYRPPLLRELRETFNSHKAFTTRIQLTRKASRNFTRRDSTLTLMLPVENCKNCLKRFFFLLNNSLYEDKFNLIRTCSSSRFSHAFLFSVSCEQESISEVNLLRQSRETVLKRL